jgi:phosphatidylserine decarboxylase
MASRVAKWGLRFLPKRTLTALVGRLSRTALSRPLIPWYARMYRIDVSEAERPLDEYATLAEFFSRRLRPEARPLAGEGLVSPVDGTVSDFGIIRQGVLLQAKGCTYTLAALLGREPDAERFEGGTYLTLYLSPRDYHRIHMPVAGRIVYWRYIPGCLYPVNPLGVAHVPGLFTKNERLVTWIDCEYGRLAMVKVGATIVGSIRTPYGPAPAGAWRAGRRRPLEGAVSLPLDRGEELGHFEFGSTVILICPPGMVRSFTVEDGQFVRMGERIACL